jgi:uridine kinase
MTKFVAIAGGSGSGKSTLSYSLIDQFPAVFGMLQLDDYTKPKDQIPVLHGMLNYDDPEALTPEKFLRDMMTLKRGKSVKVMTKSEKFNPDYYEKGKIEIEVKPKGIMLVEGYMTLCFPMLRNFYDYSFYLDLDSQTRERRRVTGKYFDEKYNKLVLRPMHEKHVEPTKKLADIVIDVSNAHAKRVEYLFMESLLAKGFL